MPRAGGDYVWQSRVIGGGIAFVLAVTGWWFILWYWAPIYGNILNVEVLQPLAATFKWDGLSDFLATDNGLFVVILATVVLAGYLVSLGMEGYAKVQKVCFYIGMIALAIVFVVMLFGSRERVPERVQPGDREPVRRQGRRLPADDRARDDEQRRSRGPRPRVLAVLR